MRLLRVTPKYRTQVCRPSGSDSACGHRPTYRRCRASLADQQLPHLRTATPGLRSWLASVGVGGVLPAAWNPLEGCESRGRPYLGRSVVLGAVPGMSASLEGNRKGGQRKVDRELTRNESSRPSVVRQHFSTARVIVSACSTSIHDGVCVLASGGPWTRVSHACGSGYQITDAPRWPDLRLSRTVTGRRTETRLR
jgi:hypothetical protein